MSHCQIDIFIGESERKARRVKCFFEHYSRMVVGHNVMNWTRFNAQYLYFSNTKYSISMIYSNNWTSVDVTKHLSRVALSDFSKTITIKFAVLEKLTCIAYCAVKI